MIEVQTPSRLHFGLLAFDPQVSRQFGGVGLMIRQPSVIVRCTPDKTFHGSGLMSDRAVQFATRFFERASQQGLINHVPGVFLEVKRVPRPHTGLGSGTQLGLAVARGLAHLIGRPDLSIEQLAQLVGRGQRSAIGAHGFQHGGLIVEGGKRDPDQLSPLLMQAPFCEAWRVVLIRPATLSGISGQREVQVFARSLHIPQSVTAELCRLIMLHLIPGMLEQNLEVFGQALFQMQSMVGDCFAEAQGGRWADPLLGDMVEFIRKQGIAGVGQSSWGPTLYAMTADQRQAEQLRENLVGKFDLEPGEILITQADNRGATTRRISVSSYEER